VFTYVYCRTRLNQLQVVPVDNSLPRTIPGGKTLDSDPLQPIGKQKYH